MLSVKGLYEWKLTDKDGNVANEGSQWNMVTDAFFEIITSLTAYTGSLKDIRFRVLLSDSVKDPAIDYQECGISSSLFNVVASGDFASNYDSTLQKKWTDFSFSPPVEGPITISIIGADLRGVDGTQWAFSKFFSFIQLSVPITQNTNQYLYVKYTLYVHYQNGGMNVPSNRFINYYLNSAIFDNIPTIFAPKVVFAITPFRNPSDVNSVSRHLSTIFNSNYNTDVSDVGARLAKRIESSIDVSVAVGSIGAIANPINFGIYGRPTVRACVGYSPTNFYTGPTVSRVFIHPESRLSQIFSDPEYPPSSNGSIAITNKPSLTVAPIIGRVNITSTGDAASTDDEAFSDTAVDINLDQITVTQNWPSTTRVRLTDLSLN